jgi:hypothetical protein
MDECRLSNLEVLPMQRFWFSVIVTLALAAFVAAQALGQKGKGGGNGKGFTPGKNSFQPQPARIFDQPKSGNALPNDIRDRLPPGLRTMPEKQPGLANQLQKNQRLVEPLNPDPRFVPRGETLPARPFDQPRSGNSLPQEVRDRLPPGLRDMPENHPGLANQLRKMGLLQDYPSVDPVPPEVRRQLPPGLRDKPYDHPGVANHLGKLGWSIGEDGALVPPPTVTPPVQPSTPYESFRPFGGLFRRR